MNLIIAIALFEKNDLCIGLQLQIVFWYLYIYLFIYWFSTYTVYEVQ